MAKKTWLAPLSRSGARRIHILKHRGNWSENEPAQTYCGLDAQEEDVILFKFTGGERCTDCVNRHYEEEDDGSKN